MSNLLDHAKKELELIGAFSEEDDFYGGLTGKCVMELMEVFAKQGHSGMSANIVANLFSKLADFKPLSLLTFEDDEWCESEGWDDDIEHFQNIRNSAVFKDGKEGRPHYIYAYSYKNQEGNSFNGSLSVGDGKRVRHCYIKDPANMPKICIDVIDWEVNKDDESIKEPGSGWWLHKLKDPEQLKELEKYYDVEYVSESEEVKE